MFSWIRLFLISSVFLFASCKHLQVKGDLIPNSTSNFTNPFFNDSTQEYVYKARIKVLKNDLNGILAIKKLNENQKRVALISDFGNTLFDLEFSPEGAKVHYVMEDLNKKFIVKKFSSYLGLLVNTHYSISETFKTDSSLIYKVKSNNKYHFITLDQQKNLDQIRAAKTTKNIATVQYYSTGNVVDSVWLKSFEFPMEMKLLPY